MNNVKQLSSWYNVLFKNDKVYSEDYFVLTNWNAGLMISASSKV